MNWTNKLALHYNNQNKTVEYISFTIDRFSKGYVFTYADFTTEMNQKEAIIKALNRMGASGKTAKLSKGKFYKPGNATFDNSLPDQKRVIKDLLEENGKPIGYLTGYSIYNQQCLTIQVSNTIQIGKNQAHPNFKREHYTNSFVKQKSTIAKENILLLQLLDAIRYIKKILENTTESFCNRFLAILKDLSENEKKSLIRLALKYPPASRALVNALQPGKITEPFFKSLNPITRYKLAGAAKVLSTTEKWNTV